MAKLEAFCAENGISCHILSKREIENYLPFDALETLNLNNMLDIFKKLKPEQQDFYDMEKGFYGKNEIPTDCEGLWGDIDKKTDTFQQLRKGFAGNKGKSVFESLYQNTGIITPTGLLHRCKSTGEGELKDLLSKMAKAL